MMKETFTKEQCEIMQSSLYTRPELAKMFNRSYFTIVGYFKRHGIKYKDSYKGGWRIANHDLFKIWSNDMAYLTGFILADGHLKEVIWKHSHSYKIITTLARKDRDHLLKLNKIFGGTYKLNDYGDKTKHPYSRLTICSRTMFYDLISLGVTPVKTYTVKWVDQCPEEFIPHMIRGIFDGDGCIHVIKEKCRPQNTLSINITGTESCMIGIKESFSKIYGVEIGRVISYKNSFRYVLNGNRCCLAFCEWIYKDSLPENRLERKYQIYKIFYDDYVNNPRTHLYMKRNNGVSMNHPHNLLDKEAG